MNVYDKLIDDLIDEARDQGKPEINGFEGLESIETPVIYDSPDDILLAPWEAFDKLLGLANDFANDHFGEDTEIYRVPYDGAFDYSGWNPLLNPEDNWGRLGQTGFDFDVEESECEKCLIVSFGFLGLPLNPIIYCRRHETPECQEEPIPEGPIEEVEEDEETINKIEYYYLKGGIYFLPEATKQARKDRPWVWFLNEDGSLHRQNIKYKDAKQTSYFAFRELSSDLDNIFYTDDRFSGQNWMAGEELHRYKYVDDYGVMSDRVGRHSWQDNCIQEDLIDYGKKQTWYPKIYVRCSKVLAIKQTHQQGDVVTTVQNYFFYLCSNFPTILYKMPWRNNHSYSIIEYFPYSYPYLDLEKAKENPYKAITYNARATNLHKLIPIETLEHLPGVGSIPRESCRVGLEGESTEADKLLEAHPEIESAIWRLYVRDRYPNGTGYPYGYPSRHGFEQWCSKNTINLITEPGERKVFSHAMVSDKSSSEHLQRVSDLDIICSKWVPQENDMGNCCSSLQCATIIRELSDLKKKLKEFEKVISPDSFPAELPRRLVDPTLEKDSESSVQVENYPKLLEFLIRFGDRTIGNLPIAISLDKGKEVKTGKEDWALSMNDIATTLREGMQLLIEQNQDNSIVENISARSLLELGIIHKIAAETRAEVGELVDFSGMKGKEVVEKIPMMLNPEMGGIDLDEAEGAEAEKALSKLLDNSEVKIRYFQGDVAETIMSLLVTIARDSKASMAALGSPIGSKFDLFEAIRKFDYNKAYTALETVKNIRSSLNAWGGTPEDLVQHLEDIVNRYTEGMSHIQEDNGEDYQYPKDEEGKPLMDIEATEEITPRLDEHIPKEESKEYWWDKGFRAPLKPDKTYRKHSVRENRRDR
ncbi:hypothetical protein [Roseofilum sp. Belize Diploria]|uniref:hypothetical protein n=1 Tax=Roseofilum sp. Belize Diploria TaxID=2821501 RepID=UPI001AFF891E|nr:hypothetical protein [Roseofilum sp. Belize Diploria]MBP0008046.1 hypothetical protein [Roseofilum sp. Belize Diploria]